MSTGVIILLFFGGLFALILLRPKRGSSSGTYTGSSGTNTGTGLDVNKIADNHQQMLDDKAKADAEAKKKEQELEAERLKQQAEEAARKPYKEPGPAPGPEQTGCYMFMPTGCSKVLSETSNPQSWFRDTSGRGDTNANACSYRKTEFNAYCERSDAVHHYNPGYGRTISQIWWHAKPTKISLMTDGTTHGGWKTGTHKTYNAFIGWDRGGNIAHYGVEFDGGNRWGHWNVRTVISHDNGTVFEIGLYQTHNGRTVWLSANSAGNMSVQGAFLGDEHFVIYGFEGKATVQRWDNYRSNQDTGYLNAHAVTRNGQAWIQAKGTKSDHTNFNLGLFYDSQAAVIAGKPYKDPGPKPTEPGCRLFLPTGCPQWPQNGPANSQTWFDPTAGDASSEACKTRMDAQNQYCGVTDAVMSWNPPPTPMWNLIWNLGQRKLAFKTTHGFLGWQAGSGNIAHYGENWDRWGHWEVIRHMAYNRDGGVHEISLSMVHNGNRRWLSANGSGGMGIETADRSDERFVLIGDTSGAYIQRFDNWDRNEDRGFVRGHNLNDRNSQAPLTADTGRGGATRWRVGMV